MRNCSRPNQDLWSGNGCRSLGENSASGPNGFSFVPSLVAEDRDDNTLLNVEAVGSLAFDLRHFAHKTPEIAQRQKVAGVV